MSACISCPVPVLNGASANSEGGRLARRMKGHCYKGNVTTIPDTPFCKVRQPPGQSITPVQSIRVNSMCNVVSTSRLTQDYVKSLLAAKDVRGKNYVTEGTRIAALEASSAICSPPDPLSLRIKPTDYTFLPTPPPPGPPARCALTKNQKF